MKAQRQVNIKYLLISFLITALIINLAGVLIAQNTSNTQPTGNTQDSQKLPLGWIDILKLLSKGLPLWLVIVICFVFIVLIWILKEPIKNIKDEKIKPSLVRFYTWILVHLGAYNRLINNYRKMLNEKLKVSGLTRQLIGEGVNLDDNYIPIQLSKEEYKHPETDYSNEYQEITKARLGREDIGRVEVEEVLADEKTYTNRIAIIGDPGAGKTTLLCHIAYELTKGKKMTQIPILIILSSYVKSQTGSLMSYIEKVFDDNGFPKAKDYIDEQIRTGNLLILMDGFDEVEFEKRSDLREQIQNLALNPEFTKNKFLVTSRPIRDAVFNGFKHLEVMPLEPEQRKVFLESKIDNSPDSPFNAKKCSDLIDSIEEHDRIRKLAENPLLLTFLYHVYKYNLELPKRRVELYRQSINLMLDWDIKTNRPTNVKVKDRDAKKEVLKKVAYHYHTNKVREIKRDELVQKVKEYLPDSLKGEFTAEELIQDIENSSGILRHKSAESYEFIHLTFQEYLAAEYINDNRDKETPELIKKLGDSWWKEVSLLLAGLMGNATSFISQIVGYCQNATDKTESLPCILIAFACIYEAEVDKEVQNQVFDAFVELPYKQTVGIIERMFGQITEDNKDIETFLSNILEHSNSSVRKWGLNFLLNNMQIYKESWDLANRLLKAGMKDELKKILLDIRYIKAKLNLTDVYRLMLDYNLLPDDIDLKMVKDAIRLSTNILNNDKSQIEAQMIGRLMPFKSNAIQMLLKQAIENKLGPWLHPMKANLLPPGGPLIGTLKGHSSIVNSVAITPDGSKVVSASYDTTLKVWDIETGDEIRTLKWHSDIVNSVAITPDGHKAISASWDNTLKVWDIETGDIITSFCADACMSACAVAVDGVTIVGDRSGVVHIMRLEGVK